MPVAFEGDDARDEFGDHGADDPGGGALREICSDGGEALLHQAGQSVDLCVEARSLLCCHTHQFYHAASAAGLHRQGRRCTPCARDGSRMAETRSGSVHDGPAPPQAAGAHIVAGSSLTTTATRAVEL
jgi:hypothetical protein